MKYTVVKNHFVAEVNVHLVEGDILHDGDCDPDLMANLVSGGVVEPESVPTREFFSAEETVAEEDEPAGRGRSRGKADR